MRKFLLFLFTVYANLLLAQYPFQDTTLSYNERAEDLLKRLTLNEKIGLLLYNSQPVQRLDIVPYNWWNEALHGVARSGRATVFPQAIGLAATFNPRLIEQVGKAISIEARAKFNDARRRGNTGMYTGLTFWSPNVNIFRDPRWGRGQETYGEDPYLASVTGAAFVRGLQGSNPKYLRAAACAKHFAVHSGPEALRHRFNAAPGQTDFFETYLPAFKTLVDSGVAGVMCAYNALYGKPCCVNKFLLDSILRKTWHFQGYIVSDCWALDDVWARYKYVNDKILAAALAAEAGVNVNCGYLYSFLEKAVKDSLISQETIDSILKPNLITRMKLGVLTENDFSPYDTITHVDWEKHQKLAYQAAAQSIVLLKNDSVLPLKADTLKRVFLTGPTAADVLALVGNYNGLSPNMVTFVEGFVGRLPIGISVDYSIGTVLSGSDRTNGLWQASLADVTIAFVGLTRLLEGEDGDALLAPKGDRSSLQLPDNQLQLLRDLRKAIGQKPLIVVVTGGSAIDLSAVDSLADAVLMAWYPGEQGGNAVADVILGKINPSGLLPITFYRSIKDLPPYSDYSMQGRTYRFFTGKPLYPFGYGLSYSKFAYSDLQVNRTVFGQNDTICLRLTVKNLSDINGYEVVQLYVREKFNRPGQPLKTLKAFKKVYIPAHTTDTVTFKLPVKALAVWDTKHHSYKVVKGKYELQAGTNSSDIRLRLEIRVR